MKLKLCNNGLCVYGTREDGATISYSLEAEEYKQWLSEGNTPEPEFTEAELAQQVKDKAIQEAYAYLASTAWITAKYNDVVTVLGQMSKADFIVKYKEIYDNRTAARAVVGEE